jgi:hypothetical protein
LFSGEVDCKQQEYYMTRFMQLQKLQIFNNCKTHLELDILVLYM